MNFYQATFYLYISLVEGKKSFIIDFFQRINHISFKHLRSECSFSPKIPILYSGDFNLWAKLIIRSAYL